MWEAARAISAAPLYFNQMKLSKSSLTFSDGGMLHNNPVDTVYHEARQIWPTRDIGIVVSIGTGIVETSGLKNKFRSMLDVTIKAMVDEQDQAQDFERSTDGQNLIGMGKNFRFNVEQGLQKIGMENVSDNDAELRGHTERYLRSEGVKGLTERCVQSRKLLIMIQSWTRIIILTLHRFVSLRLLEMHLIYLKSSSSLLRGRRETPRPLAQGGCNSLRQCGNIFITLYRGQFPQDPWGQLRKRPISSVVEGWALVLSVF